MVEGAIDDIRQVFYAMAVQKHPEPNTTVGGRIGQFGAPQSGGVFRVSNSPGGCRKLPSLVISPVGEAAIDND